MKGYFPFHIVEWIKSCGLHFKRLAVIPCNLNSISSWACSMQWLCHFFLTLHSFSVTRFLSLTFGHLQYKFPNLKYASLTLFKSKEVKTFKEWHIRSIWVSTVMWGKLILNYTSFLPSTVKRIQDDGILDVYIWLKNSVLFL